MIRYWQYLDEYERDKAAILGMVDSVFSSGRLILGSQVEEFEKVFSSYCSVHYGVGVNSGTDALFLALKALGIHTGDEVITVANTAVPTVAAIRAAGAHPVFADLEEDSFLIDANKIEAVLTERTKCILPVHLYGQPADMDPILKIAEAHSLKVIEDCAQAAGATYHNKKVGSMGDIGAFSFYPTKILGGYGDGGMAITEAQEHYQKLKRLRYYGMEREYYAEEEGYNSRLDEVQAALLSLKLKTLDESVKKRRKLAGIYSRELVSVGDIIIPRVMERREHQFYAYTIKTRYRDELQLFLKKDDIETKVNYPVPIHLMRGYSFLDYQEGDLPVTERLAGQILSLPLYPELSFPDVERVIGSVKRFFSKT